MDSREIWGSIPDRDKRHLPSSHVASRLVLRLSEPFVRWMPEARSRWIRRHGCEADHLPASCGEVNKCVEL
jgi:hypothetical protein